MKRSYVKGVISMGVLSSVLVSCAYFQNSFQVTSRAPIADLETIPQIAEILLNEEDDLGQGGAILTSEPSLLQRKFKEEVYFVWHKNKIQTSVDELQVEVLRVKGSYGENLLKRPESWLDSQVANANWPQLGSVSRPGVLVRTTDVRTLPTLLPCFDDPSSAGEGFPFDYLQETQLHLASPVFISHFSIDGLWAFIEFGREGHGWVKRSDVGWMSPKDSVEIEKLRLATLREDNASIFDREGQWIDSSKIGTVVPLKALNQDSLKNKNSKFVSLYLPRLQNDGRAIFREVKVPRSLVSEQSLQWVRSDIQFAVSKFIGKPYGWGNYLGNRDCSGMIHDFYSLFHIVLPPSSLKMLNYGRVIDLSLKSPLEKIKMIENQGVPFRTVLYRKGHVGIYAGHWNHQLLMFHAAWGVKTKNGNLDGRNLIGKTVITTLEFGKELPYFNDQTGNFLKEFSKMIVLE